MAETAAVQEKSFLQGELKMLLEQHGATILEEHEHGYAFARDGKRWSIHVFPMNGDQRGSVILNSLDGKGGNVSWTDYEPLDRLNDIFECGI